MHVNAVYLQSPGNAQCGLYNHDFEAKMEREDNHMYMRAVRDIFFLLETPY